MEMSNWVCRLLVGIVLAIPFVPVLILFFPIWMTLLILFIVYWCVREEPVRSIPKATVYLFTRVQNEITRKILYDKLGDKFDLKDIDRDATVSHEVILVYYDAVSRINVDITTALQGSPGEPRQKILVMFDNQPILDSFTHPRRHTVEGAKCMTFLQYSRPKKILWNTRGNDDSLTYLEQQLDIMVKDTL